ncbi:MAG: hypothetical protein U0Q07_03890 [Acidimicrobiales bacterium]
MDDKSGVTRRAVLGASAVGAGAAALGGLSASAAFAQTGAGTSTVDGAGQALGLAPSALPPTVPGTYAGVVSFADVNPIGLSGGPGQATYAYPGVYRLSGSELDISLPLEPGDRLLRIDVYFYRATSGSNVWSLASSQVDTGSNTNVAGGNLTSTGTGVVSSAYQPGTPFVVPAGRKLYVSNVDSDANGSLLGAIYQYRPAQPRLNLLTTPVRIYDSRPGNNPATGPKTPLVGPTTRSNLDATINGSGVPAGAAAILANVTVVNTVGSGFLVAYKNGAAQPLASTINWFGSGQVLANTTVIALDANGRFAASVGGGSQTDVFVDVIGYLL